MFARERVNWARLRYDNKCSNKEVLISQQDPIMESILFCQMFNITYAQKKCHVVFINNNDQSVYFNFVSNYSLEFKRISLPIQMYSFHIVLLHTHTQNYHAVICDCSVSSSKLNLNLDEIRFKWQCTDTLEGNHFSSLKKHPRNLYPSVLFELVL